MKNIKIIVFTLVLLLFMGATGLSQNSNAQHRIIILDSIGQKETIRKNEKYNIIYGKVNPENTNIKYIPSNDDNAYILQVVYYDDLIKLNDPIYDKYRSLEKKYYKIINENNLLKYILDSTKSNAGIESFNPIDKYLKEKEETILLRTSVNEAKELTDIQHNINQIEADLEITDGKINENKIEYIENQKNINQLSKKLEFLWNNDGSTEEINFIQDKLLSLINRNEFLLKENQNLYFSKFELTRNIERQLQELNRKDQKITLLQLDQQIKSLALEKKEADAIKKEKEIAYLEKKRDYDAIVRNSLIGAFILIATIAIIVFSFFKRKSKDNKMLRQLNEIIATEQAKSDSLLQNILPLPVANRLKEGENLIADHYNEASIVFIDIVEFTKLSSSIPAEQTITILNELFTILDNLCETYELEKIKTIGDCYMAVAGIPKPNQHHAISAAKFALKALEIVKLNKSINIRIGIDCGSVVAGVIGQKKFVYDLWGDAVNTASRMEEYGIPGRIQVTECFKKKLSQTDAQFGFIERGIISIKGKGEMKTWFLQENFEEAELEKMEDKIKKNYY
jgi:class 3 adenylate cyclase